MVKLLGMVNATPQFHDHPKVINGCSELFADVWGPTNGVGARSAVGMASLPHDIAVEIEGIFELTRKCRVPECQVLGTVLRAVCCVPRAEC